jgi:hypothetical protein
MKISSFPVLFGPSIPSAELSLYLDFRFIPYNFVSDQYSGFYGIVTPGRFESFSQRIARPANRAMVEDLTIQHSYVAFGPLKDIKAAS